MIHLGSTPATVKLKGIDGGPHKRRKFDVPGNRYSSNGKSRGAAWLSSARAVRCRLKCHNERNPRRQLLASEVEDSVGTASVSCEEGGDDVKSARPLHPGRHTCYNGVDKGQPPGDREPIPKPRLSSDRSLQPDSVKLDSLVIAHQPWRGEYVPRVKLVTGAKS